jgi:uncharacterized protein YeeX (DUF496 family)
MKIKLKNLIDNLDAADLGGLDVKNDLIKVCSLINITLQDIHSRMVLNQEEIVIPLVKGKYEYCVDDYIDGE